MSAASGTFKATTLEEGSLAGPENTLNSSSLTRAEISISSSGILRSGLSQPYFSMDSLYGILGTLVF